MEHPTVVPPPICRPKPARQNRTVASSFLKGLDLMTVLARRQDGLPMSLLVRKLNLPRTSVLRMLKTLEQYGLAAKYGRSWCATDQFYNWASRDTYQELANRYRPTVRAIASQIDELVELGIGDGHGVRYIYWEQSSAAVTVNPRKASGSPLYWTASGKLLLSQCPERLDGVPDRRIRAEIEEARTTGVAWNRRESDRNVVAVTTWADRPSSGGSLPLAWCS